MLGTIIALHTSPAFADFYEASGQIELNGNGKFFERDSVCGIGGTNPFYSLCQGISTPGPDTISSATNAQVSNSRSYADVFGTAAAAASASADLATGTIRISANGGGALGADGGVAAVAANLVDTIHFNIPGLGAGDHTTIQVALSVHGTLEGAQAYMSFDAWSGHFIGTQFYSAGNGAYQDISPSWRSPTSIDYSFVGDINVYGDDPNLALRLFLETSETYYTADLSHTASIIFLNLPQGTTFTSASGVFLSAASTTDVPEPATLALLAAPLLGLCAARRRRMPIDRGVTP